MTAPHTRHCDRRSIDRVIISVGKDYRWGQRFPAHAEDMATKASPFAARACLVVGRVSAASELSGIGTRQAKPRGKIPEPEAVERMASEEATGHPDRTERWQRGFIDGYTEGFRNVVTGKK